MWQQTEFSLKGRSRGFHLVTDEVIANINEIKLFRVGLLHLLLKHTSASLTINENADPTVRQDFESFFNQAVKENEPYFRHTLEGSDDMPAHLKSSLLGATLTIPIRDSQLALGIWQGIYLCEHRNHGVVEHCLPHFMAKPLSVAYKMCS